MRFSLTLPSAATQLYEPHTKTVASDARRTATPRRSAEAPRSNANSECENSSIRLPLLFTMMPLVIASRDVLSYLRIGDHHDPILERQPAPRTSEREVYPRLPLRSAMPARYRLTLHLHQ